MAGLAPARSRPGATSSSLSRGGTGPERSPPTPDRAPRVSWEHLPQPVRGHSAGSTFRAQQDASGGGVGGVLGARPPLAPRRRGRGGQLGGETRPASVATLI